MNGAAAVRRDVVLETPFEEAVRAGEDVPFFASLLAWHDCLTIDRPLIKLHKHPDSLRHDVTAMEHARPRMPALLFDHGRLPPELARHRPEFAARCALAQSHTYARAGRHRSALTSFGRAVALSPRVALRARPLRELARVLRRFVRSAGADG